MRQSGHGARPLDGTLEQAAAAAPRDASVLAGSSPIPAVHPLGPYPAAVAPSHTAFETRDRIDLQSTMELTIRAQGGDQLALEALCLRCLKSLTRFAAGRLPSSVRGMVETQDVVLEAVQRGMHRLHDFEVRHAGALVAYMRKILKNLIVDHVRNAVRRPQQVSLDDQQADTGQSPLDRVLDEEQISLYESALERLKPRDAALVTLKIEEQLAYDEIAIELGFPSANAARVATKRAVLRLAHEMSKLSHAKDKDEDDAGHEDAPAVGSRMRDAS